MSALSLVCRRCTKTTRSSLSFLRTVRQQSSDSVTKFDENEPGTQIVESDDPDLQAMRNISRLPPKVHSEYHGRAYDVPYKDILHIKQRYARFGAASGEDARFLWPTRQQILTQEQEEIDEGMPLAERLESLRLQKEEEQEKIAERRKMIEKNMAQMPKWIAEYQNKQKVLEKESLQRAEKKEALLEEARDYFGYRIRANDPKFQQMVEEKEEREKKEAKKRKREEKIKKQADRLAEEIKKVSQITKEKSET